MMSNKTFDRFLFFALFFMAYAFFGNLYEEIVLVPNHLTNPSAVLSAYHRYFVLSNPVYYFVPVTQLAIVVVVILFFKSEDGRQKELLKKAVIYCLLSVVVTAFIVTQINLKLFSPEFVPYADELYTLSIMWLVGNTLRMIFVGGSLYFILKTYVHRQAIVKYDYRIS